MEMEIFASVPQVALEGVAWWGEYWRFDMGLFLMASLWFQFLILLSLNTEPALALHSFIHSFTCRFTCFAVFFFKSKPFEFVCSSFSYKLIIPKANPWKLHVCSPCTWKFVTRPLIMPYNHSANAVHPFRSRVWLQMDLLLWDMEAEQISSGNI